MKTSWFGFYCNALFALAMAAAGAMIFMAIEHSINQQVAKNAYDEIRAETGYTVAFENPAAKTPSPDLAALPQMIGTEAYEATLDRIAQTVNQAVEAGEADFDALKHAETAMRLTRESAAGVEAESFNLANQLESADPEKNSSSSFDVGWSQDLEMVRQIMMWAERRPALEKAKAMEAAALAAQLTGF